MLSTHDSLEGKTIPSYLSLPLVQQEVKRSQKGVGNRETKVLQEKEYKGERKTLAFSTLWVDWRAS